MKLFIDIPKEFVEHFEKDKFEDSLERIKTDIKYDLNYTLIGISGNYELELIEMLLEAFKNCKRVNTTTISDAPLMEKEQLEQAKEIIKFLINPQLLDKPQYYEWRLKAEQFLKDCDIDNAIQQANKGLDFDKITDEMEQDLKDSEVEK